MRHSCCGPGVDFGEWSAGSTGVSDESGVDPGRFALPEIYIPGLVCSRDSIVWLTFWLHGALVRPAGARTAGEAPDCPDGISWLPAGQGASGRTEVPQGP